MQLVTIASLKTHLNTHSEDYQCTFCGHTFSQLSNLQFHKCKVHVKTKFYDCYICEDKFCSKLLVKEHLKQQHNIQFTKSFIEEDNNFEHDVDNLYKGVIH